MLRWHPEAAKDGELTLTDHLPERLATVEAAFGQRLDQRRSTGPVNLAAGEHHLGAMDHWGTNWTLASWTFPCLSRGCGSRCGGVWQGAEEMVAVIPRYLFSSP